MASSKPDVLLILLQKLMEEGNMLYKVGQPQRLKQMGMVMFQFEQHLFFSFFVIK